MACSLSLCKYTGGQASASAFGHKTEITYLRSTPLIDGGRDGDDR